TDEEGNARVYDASTSRAEGPFLKHGPHIVVHVFLGGEHVLTGDMRGTMRVWNFVSGEKIREFAGPHHGHIWKLISIPNRRLIASFGGTTARLWKADTLEEVGKPIQLRSRVVVSPDGKYLAGTSGLNIGTSGENRTVSVWEIETQREVARWETPQSL